MEQSESAPLELRLFGPFEARAQGRPLPPLRTRKGAWLLALLALRAGRQVERSWLAGTLWPDSPEPLAYGSLRRCLADLRRALGDQAGCVRAPTPRSLALDPAGVRADVLEFDTAIAAGDEPSLEQAVELYRGPLLEGCGEEWVLEERRVREEAAIGALERLAARARAASDPLAAAGWLRRAVGLDPLREPLQRELMRSLAAGGSHAAALEAYRDLREHLRRELGAAPSPETAALFHAIRSEARALAARSGRPSFERMGRCGAGAPGLARGHLPRPLTELVGRGPEIAEVTSLVERARLVTLTGSGGVGKTRLAIEVAGRAGELHADGARFVDLAPLGEPSLLPRAVMSALGIPESEDALRRQPPAAALADFLSSRDLLLVLDTCEHLGDACAHLVELLLERAPRLRILATSRQVLGITGETVWRVPSLSLPAERSDFATQRGAELSDGFDCEAVQLFLARAASVRPSFVLDSQNAAAIVQICRRLDGIPLALELAAARLGLLTVEQILSRLDDRFRLLSDGSTTAHPRHRTLRATLEWSCDLLDETERCLLRRLSVFPGSFSLGAAEHVAGEGRDPDDRVRSDPPPGDALELRRYQVLDLLGGLVRRSLVQVEEDRGESRYRLLDSTREFAREALVDAGEEGEMRDRHGGFFLDQAERARPEYRGPNHRLWLERVDAERDNLRGALSWFLDRGREPARCSRRGLRLVTALAPFWMIRGPVGEGIQWFERMLEQDREPTPERAAALMGAAQLLAAVAGQERRRALLEEALSILQVAGDRLGTAHALRALAALRSRPEDVARAREYCIRSLAIYRELQDPGGIALALARLGRVHLDAGDPGSAGRAFAESLSRARQAGLPAASAGALQGLGIVAYLEGDWSTARERHQDALAISRELGDQWAIAWALNHLGDTAAGEGEAGEAGRLYRESLLAFRGMGNLKGVIECLDGLARTADRADSEARARAVRLMAAAASLRKRHELSVPIKYREEYEARLHGLRSDLGAATFAAAWSAGEALTLEQAIAEALADAAPAEPFDRASASG